MKLFWKLFCSMVSITILACAAGGFVLIDGQFRAAVEQEVTALYEENDMLRYALLREAEGLSLDGHDDLAGLSARVNLTAGGRRVTFCLTWNGWPVPGGGGDLIGDNAPLLLHIEENQRGWVLAGQSVLHGASAFSLRGETAYLENYRNISALFAQRDSQYRTFSWLILALTAAVGALSLGVSHVILGPLDRLSAAARRLAEGELSQRVPVTGEDELGRLSADFNAMAARLEAQVSQLTDAARREKDFTASFAHEIKTPLTSIIGYADLLLSRPANPGQVREGAGYIFREGRRLEALSLKLMDLIVLERQTFSLRPVSLRAFLERTASAMRPAMEAAGLRLEVDAEDLRVCLEPELMETACVNLLDNARKATLSGGRVTLSGKAEPGGWVIRVSDTGKGIPPEELKRITEPFYMVDKSRARAQGGAGLGLALCSRIAALHEGTLDFESAPGKGTAAAIHWKGGAAHEAD